MHRALRFLLVSAFVSAPSVSAFGQSDPIQALLARYGVARTPLDAEGIIVPGSLIIKPDSGTGTTEHVLPYEISKEDVSVSDAALQDMEVVPVEAISGSSTSSWGLGATILSKFTPDLGVQNLTGLTSNQAEFTIAELTSTQVDQLVLHQKELQGIWKDWHQPNEASSSVWLVTGVFYTKQLDVANDVQRKITFASGDKLPSCPAALANATPKLPATGDGSADTAHPAAKTIPPSTGDTPTTTPTETNSQQPSSGSKPTGDKTQNGLEVSGSATIGGVKISADYSPSTSKKTTKANVLKGLAAVSDVATTAAGKAVAATVPVTVFAYSCRDSNGVAHLVSTTPVAIGVKVALLGVFDHSTGFLGLSRSKPTGFTYDFGQPIPVFTNAK